MSKYFTPPNQLIVELYVRNLRVSCAFYQQLGFQLVRDDGDFVELQWEDSLLSPRKPLQILRGQRVQVMNHLQIIKTKWPY